MNQEQTIVVCGAGVARIVAELERVEAVKARGVVPPSCGTEIPDAPARGPVKAFTPKALYPVGDDGWELKPSGHMGRDALQRADAFDLMTHRAMLAHKGKKAEFIPPFTPGQMMMGRHYRNLVERHASAGVRCSSVETMGGSGSGGDGGFIDAVLRDRDQIKRVRGRIGMGYALQVQRQGKAVSRLGVTDRRLVDMVCLEDKALAEVLRAHGWSKWGGNVTILQEALAEALNRMMGPVRRQAGYTMHDPSMPRGFQEFTEAVNKGA